MSWKPSNADCQQATLPTDQRVDYAVVGLGHLALGEILPALANAKKLKVVAQVNRYGKSQRIGMDNKPKFVGRPAEQWSEANGIVFKYTELDKPMQNAYIEKFNKTYLEGILNAHLFDNLEEV